jgi:hypothetical protein
MASWRQGAKLPSSRAPMAFDCTLTPWAPESPCSSPLELNPILLAADVFTFVLSRRSTCRNSMRSAPWCCSSRSSTILSLSSSRSSCAVRTLQNFERCGFVEPHAELREESSTLPGCLFLRCGQKCIHAEVHVCVCVWSLPPLHALGSP